MKGPILASFLSLLALSTAAPTATTTLTFSNVTFGSNATINVGGSGTIKPLVISQYHVSTGAINFNTPAGKIFKDGVASDITTLGTFAVPSALQGKQCTLHFNLPVGAAFTGSGKFDVFTSLAPAAFSRTGGPPGNLRDRYIGRFQAVVGGEATAGADGIATNPTFGCPAGQLYAGEVVPVGDVEAIEWDPATGGPYFSYV